MRGIYVTYDRHKYNSLVLVYFIIRSHQVIHTDMVSTINGIEVRLYDMNTLNGTKWLSDKVCT